MALLRAMLEIAPELGVVLKALHLHHGIRGREADEDEAFVRALAERRSVQFIVERADTPAFAEQHRLSLEAAARRLRYRFFSERIAAKDLDKVATAHTCDDQAETLILRLARGTGRRGLRGIRSSTEQGIVRPMLHIRRSQVEEYLRQLGQPWREDSTNAETRFARNRVRAQVIPLLQQLNPDVVETLSRTAEILAAEEDWLHAEAVKLLPLLSSSGRPVRGGGRKAGEELSLSVEKLTAQPVALQRRLVRLSAEELGFELDMPQVERALGLKPGQKLRLTAGWLATRSARELCFAPSVSRQTGYQHPLPLGGAVAVPEMNILVRAQLLPSGAETDRGSLSQQTLSASEVLLVRNWRAGDRYRQAHSSSEHKVKELLKQIQPPAEHRPLWPVVEAGGRVVWLMGARNWPLKAADGSWVRIETEALGS